MEKECRQGSGKGLERDWKGIEKGLKRVLVETWCVFIPKERQANST